MPELPEVETIVRELRPHLQGRVILNAHVDWPRTLACPQEDIERFRAEIRGLTIVDVKRRAKYAILELEENDRPWGACLIHLRMSGRLLLDALGRPEHLRVILDLSDGQRLYFYNMRKFGRIWLVRDPDKVLGDLGPEPLAQDFTPEAFLALIRRRRGMLKPLLLNQRFVAGLGNIYVDESLFRAGLHPQRRADTLTEDDVIRLHTAIQTVLQQAIDHHGTTFDGVFVRPQGEQGRQQEGLQVYGQTGLSCPRCGTPIERMEVGGRGTHVCPQCQPLAKCPVITYQRDS
jgi:formamidopyrimidine-DNA glycosylase